ncbi:MAG: pyruvate dehydrogenase (acetyl-transferring) E1 component subunit alpha [candidate division KSB1 bacterium]|nr:pyruvate dehydrogenase (acetyl-transferring) E1 component subunit alpha [candidate division KSB1 bacterium]
MKPKLIQYLDEKGNADEKAIADITEEQMFKMYRLMNLTRMWNDKALSLQRQGRLGTMASVRGQEASNVGMAMPLQAGDWFVPAFREYGAMFTLGISMKDQLMYWGGDERGARIPDHLRIANVCITVGAHLTHAVGIAIAAKIKGEKSMALSSSGDGSTSQGDFHESLNMAAVFKAPVVFVIQNNHWAISVPFEKQTATETIAEKAAAYAIDGVRVDGNDVFAVYKTVKKYADRAREEHKPALIELVTYRMGDHTTADDATRYRKPEEVAEWAKKDPIDRLRIYLMAKHGWTEEKEKQLIEELTQEIEQTVREYEAVESPDPTNMFKYMYAEMPWILKEQMEEVRMLYNR